LDLYASVKETPMMLNNTPALVTIILIVAAIITIVVLYMTMNGVQHYSKVDINGKVSDLMKDAIKDKPVLDIDKNKELKETKHISINLPKTDKTQEVARDKDVLYSDTYFDLFTPREDTMKLYGVTQVELDRLVEEYRREHTYIPDKAPNTLTFNLDRWERSIEDMHDKAANNIPEVRDYQESFIEKLYRQESV